jgi:hypothetical protein
MEHCCSEMSYFLQEQKVAIGYSKRFRSYFINLISSKYATQSIYYCPWCGNKLPKALDDEYDEALSIDTSIPLDDINLNTYSRDPRIPEEFKTDEWWKKRGL